MKIQTLRSHHIWFLLAAGLTVRLMVMFATDSVFDEPFLGWITVLCDVAIGYVLYGLSKKAAANTAPDKPAGTNRPIFLAALWVFNPAAIFASTVGGFYEPLIVLVMVLVIAQIRQKIYSTALILFLPAVLQFRFWLVTPDYASVSALNFFALVGGFRRYSSLPFLGFSYSLWGVVFVIAIVSGAAAALYADQAKSSKNYFLIIGGYFALLFVFAPGMQVNSLFPALAMLLIHFGEGNFVQSDAEKDASNSVASVNSAVLSLGLYIVFSATFFINLRAMIIHEYLPYNMVVSDGMFVASMANIFFVLVLVYVLVNAVWPKFSLFAPPDGGRHGIPVKYYIWALLAVGFVVRGLAIAHIDFRNFFDVDYFRMWAVQLYEVGLSGFYGSLYHVQHTQQYGQYTPYLVEYISRTDFPPVYLYVLYVIGALSSMLNLNMHGTGFHFLLFLPAILCDLAIGYVLYRRATVTQRAGSREKLPVILAAFWILSPAVILISSIWGQVESFYVLMLLLSLLWLRDRNLLPAYVFFGLAILTNPLSLILAPIYLYSAALYLRETEFSSVGINRLVFNIGAAIAVMVLVTLPFNFFVAMRHTWAGVNNYITASFNAFNFFALIGGNRGALSGRFMGLTYGFMGVVFIVAIMAVMLAAIKKDRAQGGSHYFLIISALTALMFVFSFRMIERYMFLALPFLLLHAIESRDRRMLGLYVAFSTTFFLNCFESLRWIRHMGMRDDVLQVVSLANVLLGCVLLYVLIRAVWATKSSLEKMSAESVVKGSGC